MTRHDAEAAAVGAELVGTDWNTSVGDRVGSSSQLTSGKGEAGWLCAVIQTGLLSFPAEGSAIQSSLGPCLAEALAPRLAIALGVRISFSQEGDIPEYEY